MKKRVFAAVVAAAMVVTAFTGCGSTGSSAGSDSKSEAKVEAPTEPFGDTVKYDPSVEINDGKDITVELWEWGSDELFQQIIDGYTAIHPNVTINLVDNPWEDYWTKLPLALDGNNGPAIFNVHNSYHENLINYMAPLDIPTEDLEADFNGVSAHVIDAADKYLQQRAQTEKAVKNNTGEHERAPEAENSQKTTKPSVFSEAGGEGFTDGGNDTSSASNNGHIVGIDPGHQSENVDMSATEPNGPGSSTMKAKSSTGTRGSFSGLPEYQLNLDVSLLLKDILEQRGYQVVMTRTDNDTAISNKERAELVASQGAEICVRIHANGDDSADVSGALTMCPSQQNPYVSSLYDSSNKLSKCIVDSYCAATGFQNRGIIYTDSMTGINWSTIPVTIVEMGFMTNQSDDLKMADSSFQQTMAEGIANGIDAYFQ